MTSTLLGVALVFMAGMAIAVQAPINGALGRAAEDGVLAAGISFLVGFVVLAIFMLVRGKFPQPATLGNIPWWMWTGGALGAFYVWAALTAVQKLGVLSMTAALILGQLAAALAMDASGAFGIEVRSISWQRLVSVGLVAGGLVLSRF